MPLYLNHQDLCRFSGSGDLNYTKVSRALQSQALGQSRKGMTVASSLCTDYCKSLGVLGKIRGLMTPHSVR